MLFTNGNGRQITMSLQRAQVLELLDLSMGVHKAMTEARRARVDGDEGDAEPWETLAIHGVEMINRLVEELLPGSENSEEPEQ